MQHSSRKAELQKLWRRDPEWLIAKYRVTVASDRRNQPQATLSPNQMIDAIIEHEDGHLTTTRVLRFIAA
jgi:hypothetical protein